MSATLSGDDLLLISARLSVGEAQDNRARLLGLMDGPGPFTIEFTEVEGCRHPSTISLQLCLAAAAHLRAEGIAQHFGPEAQRLLAAQNLL
ncbi:hypothetical protein [Stagnihabitans tardus]|uniref:Uncharacterized protein n=1 Tax=Stagnihabitans tardus TaxID=2699202 RepID=A0AAE5BV19_9RHOB|nr:hypothetical protein [Stagnihabitans tardus]NBZ86718.1 hypothetical protein [Stagnihabitans tardus]